MDSGRRGNIGVKNCSLEAHAIENRGSHWLRVPVPYSSPFSVRIEEDDWLGLVFFGITAEPS